MSPWLIAVIGTIYVGASFLDFRGANWLWGVVWLCYGISQYALAAIKVKGL
jgi:hypothetical protein